MNLGSNRGIEFNFKQTFELSAPFVEIRPAKSVENVQKLAYSRFISWFDFAITLQLTLSHNSHKKNTSRLLVSTWNSTIYGAIRHVLHTCGLVM